MSRLPLLLPLLLPPTLLLVTRLAAQPASLTTIPQPSLLGPEIFDSSGNLFAFGGGPVTPGAAQTRNGGGQCLVSNGFFGALQPCSDAYVGKVDPNGNLIFGTWLGGPTADATTALAFDPAGNVLFTGTTGGSFPTTPNAAISAGTTSTAFAAKLSPDGTRVLYSTYLPASAATPAAIALDAQDNAYIAGTSATGHAFILKLSPDGSTFLYNVSLAGTNQEAASTLVSDAAGNLTIAGQTSSPDFPVSAGALQTQLKGAQNLFIAHLDPTGHALFSTYLGGSGTDTPTALQTDSAGNIYLAGQTSSLDFPTTPGSFQPTAIVPLWNNSSPAGFAASLRPDASALNWSSYVMSMEQQPQAGAAKLAVTPSGETYLAGLAGAGFPVTPSAPQPCFGGPDTDIFVGHLDQHGALLDATYIAAGVYDTQALSTAADGSVLLAWIGNGTVERSQLRFGAARSNPPACLSSAVLNSATLSAFTNIVPGEFITLTGFGIGPNVQVLFDGQPAPVLYAAATQINAQAPVELSGRTSTNITVLSNESTVGQSTIGTITASVAAFGAPGIFRAQPGISAQAVAVNQDGTYNSATNPAARGSVVAVWGTGFGILDTACPTGSLNPYGPANLAPGLSVDIAEGTPAGVPVPYAPALYAGSAPTLPCGIVQINMQVPADAQPGLYSFRPWSLMALPGGAEAEYAGQIGPAIYIK